MSKKEFLLSDEHSISEIDYNERKEIYNVFSTMPEDFFSKLRHFQPQIGCLNCCSFCSKCSVPVIEYWNEERIRNVIAALKYSSKKYRETEPLIVYDRHEHRNQVIFSYSDNDIGNYKYLDKFIELSYKELGVRTRISTVGYSRHNKELNKMHKKIAKNHEYLGGVRLSFTPYAIGWSCSNDMFSREDYKDDISNFLKIYYPYYKNAGSGYRKMCVELRYKPFVKIRNVIVGTINGLYYIYSDKYLYVSKDNDINFKISNILEPLDHSIILSEKPIKFYHEYLSEDINDIEEYIVNEFSTFNKELVDIYLMKNEEGIYYSIEPSIKNNGNYGINIYPVTAKRSSSGYLITERFFLNTLIDYKKKIGLNRKDEFKDATWIDVNNVLNNLKDLAEKYASINNYDKASYIMNHVLTMVLPYSKALESAGYPASCFFDPKFTIDTGIICNMGRAVKEFKGLTNKINNPLTPTHERNYGKTNSTMIVENIAWKLNCGYEDSLVIEKLNLCNTATEEGQIVYNKNIILKSGNEKLTKKDLNSEYLIPGQRRL